MREHVRGDTAAVFLVSFLSSASVLAQAPRPVCDDPAYLLDPNSDVYTIHRLFNAGGSSERVFSRIHYTEGGDPNLTMGMGHFTYDKLSELFQKLRSDQKIWEKVTDTWVPLLNESHWKQLSDESGIQNRTAAGLTSAIDKLLCAREPDRICVTDVMTPWTKQVGAGFENNGHWLKTGWRVVSRLPEVAEVQLEHWADGILQDGVREAKKRGIENRGGIASVISAQSSGLGSRMFPAGATEAQIPKANREWSLKEVPAEAQPAGAKVDEPALLQDWRALVAWQYFTVKANRVRSRMIEIWRVFYEPSWGALPSNRQVESATSVRQHTGCYMRDEPFDFTVRLTSEDPTDCSRSLPRIPQEQCVTP